MNRRQKKQNKKLKGMAKIVLVITVVSSVLYFNANAINVEEGESVAAYAYSTVMLGDGDKRYIAQDTRGNRYSVNPSGHNLYFSGQWVSFIKIAPRDGKWYIKEVMEKSVKL